MKYIKPNKSNEKPNKVNEIIDGLVILKLAETGQYEDKIIIANTLLNLPENIKEKVLGEVNFVVMPNIFGEYIGRVPFQRVITKKELEKCKFDGKVFGWPEKTYLIKIEQQIILLNLDAMRRKKKSKFLMMSSVAHEIAHFILGHEGANNSNPLNERKADDLVEKWGFKRVYKKKDYKQFEKKK